jgi:hypothetical protein
MQSGTFIPSSVPYGYRLDGKELKIVPNEATVVCEIFKEYLSGKSKALIADELNQKGIPTRSGKPWYHSTISYIIRNERYIGNALLQKRYTSDILPYKKKYNKGDRLQYYIYGSNPQIISTESFNAAQLLLQGRAEKITLSKEYELAFSQKIKCGCCGSVFKKKLNKQTVFWVCRTHDNNKNNCKVTQIPQVVLAEAFAKLYYKLKHHSEDIFQPMLSKLQTIENRRMLWSMDVIELNNQISDLQCQNQMLTQLNQQGLIDSDIFIYQSNEIASQMRELKRKKAQAMDNGDDKTMARTREIIEALESDSESMDEFDEPMFNELVEKIIVDSNEQIRFRLKNGLELTEQIERTKR